jgi:RNA ligase
MKYEHYDKLKEYVELGLVEVNKHPDLPLYIYNYSRTVQYESKWDEVTLTCRGLILDENGEIVARSFDKFFNFEEVKDLDWNCEHVWIQEKMDGSLLILFNYQGQWYTASRGSFTSEQAIKGMEILKSKYDISKFMPECVYICEVIYPTNRIVVDYGGVEKVTFLSASDRDSGTELNWNLAVMVFNISGIEKDDLVLSTLVYDADQSMLEHLKSHNSDNREGYVLRFFPGNQRVKIKFEEYVRLHRLLTNFSNVDIWECLKNGDDMDAFLERVPDEFDKWVKTTISDLKYHHYKIWEYCGKVHDYFRYGKYSDRDPEPTKKEFALHIQNCIKDKKLHGIMFAIWDRKNCDQMIWKLLKPKYQKPFWNKEDK